MICLIVVLRETEENYEKTLDSIGKDSCLESFRQRHKAQEISGEAGHSRCDSERSLSSTEIMEKRERLYPKHHWKTVLEKKNWVDEDLFHVYYTPRYGVRGVYCFHAVGLSGCPDVRLSGVFLRDGWTDLNVFWCGGVLPCLVVHRHFGVHLGDQGHRSKVI